MNSWRVDYRRADGSVLTVFAGRAGLGPLLVALRRTGRTVLGVWPL